MHYTQRLSTLLVLAAVAWNGAHGYNARRQPMLDMHNAARNAVNLTDVFWNSKLSRRARKWARKCDMQADVNATNSESVAWGTPYISAESVFGSWYAQRSNLKNNGKCSKNQVCEDYERIVDPKLQQIGCASAVCDETYLFHVCRYTDKVPCRKLCAGGETKKERRMCRKECRVSNITAVFPEALEDFEDEEDILP